MIRQAQFPALSRLLHWLMAMMLLCMLCIGVGMVSSVALYSRLVSLHRPLGIAILALVVLRLINRWVNPPPPLPDSVPPLQRFAAVASHYALYALMFVLPIVGWAMLSAAPQPVTLGGVQLPPILAPNAVTYGELRQLHTILAYLLFTTIVVHFGAALLHAMILRDGVFESMASIAARHRGDDNAV